jgi:hypothetical protein
MKLIVTCAVFVIFFLGHLSEAFAGRRIKPRFLPNMASTSAPVSHILRGSAVATPIRSRTTSFQSLLRSRPALSTSERYAVAPSQAQNTPADEARSLDQVPVLVIDEPIFEAHPTLTDKVIEPGKHYREAALQRTYAILSDEKLLPLREHGMDVASLIVQGNPNVRIIPSLFRTEPRTLYRSIHRAYKKGCRLVNLSASLVAPQADLSKYSKKLIDSLLEDHPEPRVKYMVDFLEDQMDHFYSKEMLSTPFVEEHIAVFAEMLRIGDKEIEPAYSVYGNLNRKSIDFLRSLKREAEFKFQTYSNTRIDNLFKAIENHPDMLFVISAGNDGINVENAKEQYVLQQRGFPNVIVVASVNSENELSRFSNYGKTNVHLAAIGEAIPTVSISGKTKNLRGTSFAAPQVVNVISKMKAINPQLSPEEIIHILQSTVTKTSELEANLKWGGILNEEAALEWVSLPTTNKKVWLDSFPVL